MRVQLSFTLMRHLGHCVVRRRRQAPAPQLRSYFATGLALLLLINVLGCGNMQDADKKQSDKPMTQTAKPKPQAEKPMPQDKPKAPSDKAKGQTGAKQNTTPKAAAAPKTAAGLDRSRTGPVPHGDPTRVVACLTKRGYGQVKTFTGASSGGRGKQGGVKAVPLIIGPPRQPQAVANLLYLDSASEANRLSNTLKARTRGVGAVAYQVVGRVVIQYARTPSGKLSQDIVACIR